MATLRDLIRQKGVRIMVRYGAPPNEEFPDSNGYTVTLHYRGRQMTLPFYQGHGITEDPTVERVLDCVLSDAVSADEGSTFEEFCGEYGYDTDSRRDERIYRACQRSTKRLHHLLGGDFDAFMATDRD